MGTSIAKSSRDLQAHIAYHNLMFFDTSHCSKKVSESRDPRRSQPCETALCMQNLAGAFAAILEDTHTEPTLVKLLNLPRSLLVSGFPLNPAPIPATPGGWICLHLGGDAPGCDV